MKGEISYRHSAVNNYAFCCKVGQYVGIDFLLEPVAIQGTAVLHFFFLFFFVLGDRGFCSLRRKAEMLKKQNKVLAQSTFALLYVIIWPHLKQYNESKGEDEQSSFKNGMTNQTMVTFYFLCVFCFLLYLAAEYPGQARCQTASGHLFGVLLQQGICVAVFCLIRSSKQGLIKKQLLMSPLRHRHTHRYMYACTRTQKQTRRIDKITQTHQ